MVKMWSREKVVDHPWERVSAATWLKYPNPQAAHVSACDVVNRKYDSETGKMRSTRLIQCLGTQLPSWISNMISAKLFDFAEDSEVDIREKTHTMISRNVSLTSLVQVEEKCTYAPHPENPAQTILKQEVRVSAFPFGVRSAIESACIDRFTSNASKGLDLLNSICDDLKTQSDKIETTIKNAVPLPSRFSP